MARHFRGTGHILRFIEYMDVGHTNGWRMDDVVPATEIVETIDAEFAARAGRARVPRRGREALALRGRRRRDRRHRVGDAAVLRRLHPRAALGRGPALHVPLRRARPRPARARPQRRDRRRARRCDRRIWSERTDRYSELRSAERRSTCRRSRCRTSAARLREASQAGPRTLSGRRRTARRLRACTCGRGRSCRRCRKAVSAARLDPFRAPDRDLARLPRRVPDRPRARADHDPARGVRERAPGHRLGADARAPALSSSRSSTSSSLLAPARARGVVDVLELRVHRRLPDAALGLPAPARAFARFRNTLLLANVIGLARLRRRADGAAADVPGFGFADTLGRRRPEPRTASSSSPRTPTRRCRACTPPTR